MQTMEPMDKLLKLLEAKKNGLLTDSEFNIAKSNLFQPGNVENDDLPPPPPPRPSIKREREEIVLTERTKRVPCKYYATGQICVHRERCRFLHADCWYGQDCKRQNCGFRH